jgi:hypothetical protein
MVSDLLFAAGVPISLVGIVWAFWYCPPLALASFGIVLVALGLARHLQGSTHGKTD